MGTYYLRQWHIRWFCYHISPETPVMVRDVSYWRCGFSLSGPDARATLASLTYQNLPTVPFMGCAFIDIGLIRTRNARMSVMGALRYDINCRAGDHIILRKTLLSPRTQYGTKEIGFCALDSLRLEKSFGIWSEELTQDHTPGQTGLDRWVAFDKGHFIGRTMTLTENEDNLATKRLITLMAHASSVDTSSFEPVWSDGNKVGYITLEDYGHALNKSLTMAMADPEYNQPGARLTPHVVGVEYATTVIPPSPYDPKGGRLRGNPFTWQCQ